MLDTDKKLYMDWLMAKGEKIVMDRRSRIRTKTVEETYKECAQSIPYEVRNNFIESRIELRFKYFDQLDDLKSSGSEIETIRRKLAKVTAQLKQKEGRVVKEKVMSYMSERAGNNTFNIPDGASQAPSDLSYPTSNAKLAENQFNPFIASMAQRRKIGAANESEISELEKRG